MPTSIHIPPSLLEAVDRKARALGTSRNRLIVAALERETQDPSDWSPRFFERLAPLDDATANELEESLAAVRKHRRSKRAPRL